MRTYTSEYLNDNDIDIDNDNDNDNDMILILILILCNFCELQEKNNRKKSF